jgi:hypothetical protein
LSGDVSEQRRLTRRLALDPDVPFLDDQPVRVEA